MSNQKIYINARFLTQPITGVQRFAIEISTRLKQQLGNEVQLVAPNNIIHHDLANKLGVRIIGKTHGHIWEQFTLPIYFKNKSGTILLNLCNTAPFFYKNNIVTVHDLAFFAHPNWFSLPFRLYYRFLIPQILKRTNVVFTVSQFSKQEIIDYIKIPEKNIFVVNNGVSNEFMHKKFVNTKSNFILFVGSLDPRKNIQSLINTLKFLPQEISLKIVGKQSPNFNEQINIPNEIVNRIQFTGYIPDIELNKLYNEALCFIYPSLYEGFGIPPLEAQALGTLVIVSDIPVFREIFGDSVIYCNPNSPEDIADKIKQIENSSSDVLKILLAKGFDNVKRYSWEISAEKIQNTIKNKDYSNSY